MHARLDHLCAGIDRTSAMGPFPHDNSVTPLDTRHHGDLVKVAHDVSESVINRDQAIWKLVYDEDPKHRSKDVPDLLHSIATTANAASLRRSGSWGLLKLGESTLLANCLAKDDDGNVHSWKQTLIYESQGRTDWVDPRPVRAIKSDLGYAVTLPLSIHGMVQFRSHNYSAKPGPGGLMGALNYGATGGKAGAGSYTWYSLVAGLDAQRRLVGDLTASVGKDTFYDNLIIQKVCTNPLDDGRDHVQGYLFQGMSRSIGGNAMAHYYMSRTPQPLYLSGRIADSSEGVIEVGTQLARVAETNIVTNDNVPYPYVQSVRGLFYGPARMNTIVTMDANAPLDNLLQIVKEPYANGWFFGEFRSVPVDVDGDGIVEINGLPMYTDLQGSVVDRTPPSTVPFAR
jgi:hypothetical protein